MVSDGNVLLNLAWFSKFLIVLNTFVFWKLFQLDQTIYQSMPSYQEHLKKNLVEITFKLSPFRDLL